MKQSRIRLRLEGFAGLRGAVEVGHGVVYVTGGDAAAREVLPRLLYALWLPAQPLPPRGYADIFAENLREVFGGDPGGGLIVEGCGARLEYRGGAARVEASFDPRERVESDERIVDSVKRFCLGSRLARSLYRGDVQRCLEELREGWSQVLLHEALMCGLVHYAPEPHTGLPRAAPPSLLGPERLCGARRPEGLKDADPVLALLAEPLLRGGVEEASVAPILAEVSALIGSGRTLLAVIEPALGLHPRSARLIAWVLLRIASRGVLVAASTASEALLAEARLQALLGLVHARRPATAAEKFASVIRGLGVEIDAREATRIANSVLSASGEVRVVVVEGGGVKPVDIEVLVESLPGVADAVEAQVRDTLSILEVAGV